MTAGRKQRSVSLCNSAWMMDEVMLAHIIEQRMNIVVFRFGMCHDVQSVEQKSIGLIFRTSRSGSDVRYSCHHNSSRFAFPIFVHSWRFSVFHSLQSITPRIY